MDGRAVCKDSVRRPFESDPAAHGTGAVHGGTPCSSPTTVCPRSIYKKQHAFKKRQKLQPE
jgi:hypothetical protein